MRKFVLLVIVLLLVGFKATAQQRTEQEALQIARDFWGPNAVTGSLSVVQQQKVWGILTSFKGKLPCIYDIKIASDYLRQMS